MSGQGAQRKRHDVIVVGGGSAGAALAGRLSENAAVRVLLLEAGPAVRSSELPRALRAPFVGPALDIALLRDYHWVTLTARANATQFPRFYFRGRGLGGSSNINGLLAVRPLLDDFDAWGPRWRSAIPAAFARLESDLDYGTEPYHGAGGPIPIARWPRDAWHPIHRAFYDVAVGAGHRPCPDVNAPDALGVFSMPMNMRGGVRVTPNDGYLEPARERDNLQIVGHATVDKVVFDGTRAVGVTWRDEQGAHEARGGEVVLSAGAVQSAAILQRSGVGPERVLTASGIEVRVALPVGVSIQDHAHAVVSFMGVGAPEEETRPESRPVTACGVRYSSGLAGAPPGDMMLMAGRRFTVGPIGLSHHVLVLQHASYSRGTLQITSADPEVQPSVELGLLSDERDLVRLRDGVRRALALASDAAFAPFGAQLAVGLQGRLADELDSDAKLDAALLDQVDTSSHICSTCPMGEPGDARSVVDHDGRVLGTTGLRVADLSIVPHVPRSPPNLTSIAIGEVFARLLQA